MSDALRLRGFAPRLHLYFAAIAGVLMGMPNFVRAELVRLNDVEQQALKSRLPFGSDLARARAAAARIELARAAYRPTLGLGAEGSASPGGRLVTVEDVNAEPYLVQGSREFGEPDAYLPNTRYGLTLSLSGRLYDFGRTRAAVEAAEAELSAVKTEVRESELRILADVRARYLEWLASHASFTIIEQSASHARSERQALEGRIEEGARSPAELPSAKFAEARAELELARAAGRLKTAHLILSQTAGFQLSESAEPDYSLFQIATPIAETNENPAIDAIERRRDAALATARQHRRGRAPLLSGLAEAGIRGQGLKVFPAYRAGLALTIPIWDGGVESAEIELAEARAEELSARARHARELSQSEQAREHLLLAQANEQLTFAEQVQKTAAQALEQAEQRYELGAAPLELVIEARARVAQAGLELTRVRVTRVSALLRLGSASAPLAP